MTAQGSNATTTAAASFREAIANWRLALHTEVKKASALPTAMFDACDPMLETRLRETAEVMLARLQEPDPSLVGETTPNDDQRLEVVTGVELRALPQQVATGEHGPLDLQSGLGGEYLAILADTCCSATGPLQHHAVQRLCQDFGVSPHSDLDALTQLLAQQAKAAVAANAKPRSDEDLASTCRRVAAAVTLHGLPPSTSGPAA